jgi:hypothetical protein
MRRAARADGWLPNYVKGARGAYEQAKATPEAMAAGIAWIREHRQAAGLQADGFDVISEGVTPAGDRAAARAATEPWAAAGATWWIEGDWSVEPAEVRAYAEDRLAAGPPR